MLIAGMPRPKAVTSHVHQALTRSAAIRIVSVTKGISDEEIFLLSLT